jgi:hypothetical protein
MAFVETVAAVTASTSRGLKLDGYSAEIHVFTKSGGDTTGTVYSTQLRRIMSIEVYDAVGAVIAAVATIDNSVGQSSHESFASVALTTLGAGTSGAILLKGSRR